MNVQEDREEVRQAQKRVRAKSRLEKWEGLVIVGLFFGMIALLVSRFL